jgi:muramidase (phage lysozyme)
MASQRELIEQWIQSNPQQFAGLKNAIKNAEGSDYNVLFGGGRFNDYSKHPDKVIRSGGYASAAAGIGQFMPGTWAGAQKALGLSDFSPQNQDLALAYLARNRLMPLGGLSALSKQGMSPEVQARLAPEWASFPTMGGSSYYGQPVKKQADIQKYYEEGMKKAGSTTPQAASSIQQQATSKSYLDPQNLLAAFAGELLLNSPVLQTSVLDLAMKEMSPIQRDVFSAQSLTPVSPYLSSLTNTVRLPGL